MACQCTGTDISAEVGSTSLPPLYHPSAVTMAPKKGNGNRQPWRPIGRATVAVKQQDQYKDHLENLKLSFLEAAERLENINTIPVFATIAPFHIKTWNNFRLKIGATRYLNHAQEYPLMQRKINKLIPEMNNFIRDLNRKHEPSLATPDLAKFNIKSGGKSRPYDIGYEGMDLDGCHPNDPAKCLKGRKLVNDWYTELDLKMSKNRMTTASEKAIRISMGH